MQNCYECGKKGMWQASLYWEGERRWWHCRNCDHWQLEVPAQGLRLPPKVLYFDIETSLTEMQVSVFDMRVRSGWLDWHEITNPFYIICWTAAWVNDKPLRLHSGAVTGWEARRRCDKRHLRGLWELLDLADYVVGHNSKAFDIKKTATRFLLNGFPEPSLFKQIDTWTEAKKRFKPESQALDYWARLLGSLRKDEMRREDWRAINRGDEKTIRKMLKYNRGDILAGIEIFKKFRAYIESSGGVLIK